MYVRLSLDLTFLWLWHRPVATAPLRPLAWETPYGAGAAVKRQKDKKKKKKRERKKGRKKEKKERKKEKKRKI